MTRTTTTRKARPTLDPDEVVRKAVRALDGLGDTRERIVRNLERLGVRGVPCDSRDCLLARYLARVLPPGVHVEVPGAHVELVFTASGGETVLTTRRFLLREAALDLVDAFDAGRLGRLEAPEGRFFF